MRSRILGIAVLAAVLTMSLVACGVAIAGEPAGLVGRWTFDDGTGKDLSGNGNTATLGEQNVYSLGKGRACLELQGKGDPMEIPTSPDSPLAISSGTFSCWLNVGWSGSTFFGYDNKAVNLNVYRGCLQVRFTGDKKFRYWDLVLDYNWPKYDMREFAFYPAIKASVGDSEWHLFTVAYDVRGKRIIGWRDGELIGVVDLSATDMEPLKREGLKKITIGDKFVGYIDDIRVYNRVLTDHDVRRIYNATKSVYAGRRDSNPTDKTQDVYRYQEKDKTLYRAWLQYRPVSNARGEDMLKQIVAESTNSTVHTAASELTDAVKDMYSFSPSLSSKPVAGPKVVLGTSDTSSWIRKHADTLGLDRIKADGFVIKTVKDGRYATLVVAGNIPAGVIFGTFDLIRRIETGQDPSKLDVIQNPTVPIRMVDHWAYFRGFLGDKWRGGGRDCSIFSWKELRDGNTKMIRDWVRMMASAGWNALCPSEVNWSYRDDFIAHLDEVETLGNILRDYGMKLYWSPSYLQALKQETADQIYARVPDFGGYMMKLGSEKQNGDPRPPMVNRIADTLLPYGGITLVRGFVYGNYRYTREPYRNLIPYDLFAHEDGNFRKNVVIIPKGSPLDWDFSAPIPALDGAMQKNMSGSEQVIDKGFPSSWVEKWKWWMEQDNYHNGPGSLNKFNVDCIMGVAMISPAPAWAKSPLNMVNYYGLGRLGWNPDLTCDEIYTEWIKQTFSNDPEVVDIVKKVLFLSDDVTRKLYNYRGYRGMWLDTGDKDTLTQTKTTHAIGPKGMGPKTPKLQKRTLAQYAPGLRKVYGDPVRGEEFISSFLFEPLDYRLTIGRTLAQDFYENMDEAVGLAQRMVDLWKQIDGKIDQRQYAETLDVLEKFVEDAQGERDDTWKSFSKITGTDPKKTTGQLTRKNLAKVHVFNVQQYGAVADGFTNDAPAINKAIDACNTAGGGTVFVPTGIYATGSIHLKSNVALALDKGAVLKAIPGMMDPWEANLNDKGLMDSAYYHWEASLIWGKNLENVKIYGPGTLDGSELTRSSKVPKGIGDKGIALKLCKNVEIRNLNIEQGGHYAILATGCTNMLIDNVTINTSRDGLNLSQCSDVEVAYCHIDSLRYADGHPAGGDDAIKFGSDLSLGKARPSENVYIHDCYLASGCNGLQFGSETIAPFRNIRFENIRIRRAGKAGISITSNDGSNIENIHYKNIKMEKTFAPIFIKVSDVARVPKGTYTRGSIRNVTFENITATDCYSYFKDAEMPCVIWGKPDSPIEGIEFKNVSITAKGGHPVTDADVKPKENDERFPRHIGKVPAYAWYLRHVKDVRFIDCDFTAEEDPGRPGFVINDVDGILLKNVYMPIRWRCSSRIDIRNGVKGFTMRDCQSLPDMSNITCSDDSF